MKLITLLRNIFSDKNIGRQLSDKRFNVILKNKIKNYYITNLNVLIGNEHSEHHIVLKFNDEYLIASDEDTDVLNFNIKLDLRNKQGKLIDTYNFNETVYKGCNVINISEYLINFKKTF